jgi:hypothetical protein
MKTKQFLLTIVLLFSTLLISAQDKYEFMIISYFPASKYLAVAIDGKEVLHEDITADKHEKVSGSALLKKISEYQDKDWEVITFTNASNSYTGGSDQEFYAYLKKKKPQNK